MRSPFYNDIYEILQAQGCKGLPVNIIAKHVYNRHAGLFSPEFSYERIYQNIRFFLWAQAGKASSPFMPGAHRGWYALKPTSAQQLHIDFKKEEAPTIEAATNKEEQSADHPSLF